MGPAVKGALEPASGLDAGGLVMVAAWLRLEAV
jgi:hypothetical protein